MKKCDRKSSLPVLLLITHNFIDFSPCHTFSKLGVLVYLAISCTEAISYIVVPFLPYPLEDQQGPEPLTGLTMQAAGG